MILLDAAAGAPITFADLTPLLTFAGMILAIGANWAVQRAQLDQLRGEMRETRDELREVRKTLADVARIDGIAREIERLDNATRSLDTRVTRIEASRKAEREQRRHDSIPTMPLPDDDSDKHS